MKQLLKSLAERTHVPIRLLQEVRYQQHLLRLTLRNAVSPAQARKRRALATRRDVRLHFGCGSRILDGWVNIDAWPCDGIDYVMDLTRALPFADGAVRCVFTEHVLEHLDRERLPAVLSEWHRVLQAEGVVRVIVPDLAFYCHSYVAGDIAALTTPLPEARTAAEAVNSVFKDHFHRYIYDFDTLRDLLLGAGFVDVHQTAYLGSAHEQLNRDSDVPARSTGSLCVEARRPAGP